MVCVVNCSWCSKLIKTLSSQRLKNKSICCSYKCSYNYRNSLRPKRSCKWCSKEKIVTKQNIRTNKNFFCNNEHRIKYEHSLRKEIVCNCCGKLFYLPKCRLKDKAKYCSKSCMYKSIGKLISKKMRGENNPRYIKSKVRRKNYDMCRREWVELKKQIRYRDGYVCQECGNTEKILNKALAVHHIIPYRISFSNSPSNLISLCIKCHTKVEHVFCILEKCYPLF